MMATASLAELERDHDFPTTWRVMTGGGGEHVIFACPEGVDRQFQHGRRAIRCSVPASISGPATATSSRRRRGNLAAAPMPGTSITIPPRSDRRGAGLAGRGADRRTSSLADGARRDAAQWAIDKAGLVTEYRDMAVASVAGKLLRAGLARSCLRRDSGPRLERAALLAAAARARRRRHPRPHRQS